MGANMELVKNSQGKHQLLFIDKGGEKIDVGNKKEDFDIISKLGEGCFGCVYKVTSKKTGKLYAMKEIKFDKPEERLENQKEIKLLENLHHPHVITYFNSFSENGFLYIVTEYINGGSLEKIIDGYISKDEHMEEKKVWDYLVQCLSGLLYLHQIKKIIHRDIKPDNILVDGEDNIKISDFGISARLVDDSQNNQGSEDLTKCHQTIVGPIAFMSPEMEVQGKYDFKSDIYMLGLTFFILLSFKLPINKGYFGPFRLIIKNKDAKIPDQYSQELKDFVEKLIETKQENRPTTIEAYTEATTIYSKKFLKTTGMGCILECFSSLSKINNYFTGERLGNFLTQNDEKSFLVTSSFRDILKTLNKNQYDIEAFNSELLKFRVILFIGKERFQSHAEVNLLHFVQFLLSNLHNELNKKPLVSSIVGISDDLSNNFVPSKDKEKDEKAVLAEVVNKFTKFCHSKISDYFCYITKITDKCVNCGEVLKYHANLCMVCSLYPDRAVKYIGKKNIDVCDLFKHYEKERLYSIEGEGEKVCSKCNISNKKFNRIKKMYSSPLIMVISLEYEDEKAFELSIQEDINICNFVQMNQLSKVKYHLTGVIYEEKIKEGDKDITSYSSITKQNDGKWIFFDGKVIKNSSYNDIKSKSKPLFLFYQYYD